METENKFLIPLSVLIAGALIGGAVFFKSKAPTNEVPDPTRDADITVEPLSADDHVLGNPNAPITIIEFSDIDCPFCQTFDATMRRVMDKYGPTGEVSWVYRQFPLDSLHPQARLKSEATECVASLGGNEAFWEYLGILFERSETASDLSTIAAEVGVDATAFEACLDAGTFKDAVQDDVEAALAAGVRGTPYSVIIGPDGKKYPINGAQPYEVITQVIDTILLQQATQ